MLSVWTGGCECRAARVGAARFGRPQRSERASLITRLASVTRPTCVHAASTGRKRDANGRRCAFGIVAGQRDTADAGCVLYLVFGEPIQQALVQIT